MQGYSDAFATKVSASELDPADHVERTAWLLELLAAEVRRFGVIEGELVRDQEADGDGVTGVHKILLNLRIDHNEVRNAG